VAFGDTPLLAVIVMGKTPLVVAVPLSTPADVKVTPLGSVPVSLKVGAGKPVAVTVNDPAVFATNVVLAALVIVGGVGGGCGTKAAMMAPHVVEANPPNEQVVEVLPEFSSSQPSLWKAIPP